MMPQKERLPVARYLQTNEQRHVAFRFAHYEVHRAATDPRLGRQAYFAAE
jgi:hypothetical protein